MSVFTANFESRLLKSREYVDQAFLDFLKHSHWHSDLKKYSEHVFVGGGKALRPALVFWSFDQLSGSSGRPAQGLIQVATALEMIHTYSLVHDDLPSMDNDDFRRGKPTIHRLKNEAAAILTGDALLTGAFEMISAAEVDGLKKLLLIKTLAEASGGAGMVSGQMRDMFDQMTELSQLKLTHNQKTGALFGASIAMASIFEANFQTAVKTDRHKELFSFGVELGLLFQIVDDLLDATATKDQLGKTPGKDAESGKTTYVSLLGSEATQKAIENLKSHLLESGEKYFDSGELSKLLSFVTHRKS